MSFGSEILAFIKRVLNIGQSGQAPGDNNPGKVDHGPADQPGEVGVGQPGEVPGDAPKQGTGGLESGVATPGEPSNIE
jgi:hypothetical protein